MDTKNGAPVAAADVEKGTVLASIELDVPPARLFQALASAEVAAWWVRPGVFDTRHWQGDVVAGGRWLTSGLMRGEPYELAGEYLEVDPPRRLVHTWQRTGNPGEPTTVAYSIEPTGKGTRLILEHTGFAVPEACEAFAMGWQTSLERLVEILDGKHAT